MLTEFYLLLVQKLVSFAFFYHLFKILLTCDLGGKHNSQKNDKMVDFVDGNKICSRDGRTQSET